MGLNVRSMIIWESNRKNDAKVESLEGEVRSLQSEIERLTAKPAEPAGQRPAAAPVAPVARKRVEQTPPRYTAGARSWPPHSSEPPQESSFDELAEALRASSMDNPGGGNSFTIQGGQGESKKVITEQAKIFLEDPFPTPGNLRAWKYKLVTAIQQCTGKLALRPQTGSMP